MLAPDETATAPCPKMPDTTGVASCTTPRSAPKAYGTLVPGYEIVREIASGGMGVVYEARQTRTKRTVALKMTLAGGAASANELARFQREYEVLASFSHPNVVQLYDAGDVGGLPYFALEFCTGGTLASAVAVHRRGVVHRDLKPANVLFAEDGTLKVADFGLARDLGCDTQTGAILGTPAYMAPEQARGETGQVGPHSDVYALGAILCECLTGRPPFTGANTAAILAQVLTGAPVPRLRKLRPGVSCGNTDTVQLW